MARRLKGDPDDCGCGKGRGSVPPPSIVPDRLQANGVYQLLTWPDCTEAYIGAHMSTVIYVVGFRTEHERLFKRSDKGSMMAYYNQFQGTVALWHDFASAFCAPAMTDLLGA